MFALSAALACAQGNFEISGTVREPAADGPGLGIPGVEVTLSEFVTGEDGFVVRRKSATTFTDGAGQFRFRPEHAGQYYLEAQRDGYSSGNVADRAEIAEGPVSVSREKPRAVIPFQMMRPAELAGRVIDEDGKPVAGLPLYVLTEGTPLFQRIATGENGAFTATQLRPGKYTLQVQPEAGPLEHTAPFSEEEFAKTDQDWESAYWPGGGDLASAVPLAVAPGSAMDLGTIRVRRVPYYRVHVTAGPDACVEGKMPLFSAIRDPGPSGTVREWQSVALHFVGGLPCAPEFLVENLRPGRYWFAMFSGKDGVPGRWALAPVEITDSNVEVAMTLLPAIDVTGRLVAAEGSELPPFKEIEIQLGIDIRGLPAGSQKAQFDDKGAFTFPNVYWPRRVPVFQGLSSALPGSAMFNGSGATHYVEAIRYNGAESADGLVALAPGAELEIVIGDKPASLSGTVMNGASPAQGAGVVLVKWPIARIDPFRPYQFSATSGENGKFQLTGLPPGEYRVLAIPVGGLLQLGEPGVLNQLAASAERVTLERGGSQTVELKLVDPGR